MLGLMLSMEVLRLVLLVLHPDHDAEEDGDDRHDGEYSVVRQQLAMLADAWQSDLTTSSIFC